MKEILGQTDSHTESFGTFSIHHALRIDLEKLIQAAQAGGFELKIASGFRSFDRQLVIWNEKVSGKRALVGDDGQPLNSADLKPRNLIYKILRWSALPGLSRHHWGTDVDVYDGSTIDDDYKVQLTVQESKDVFGSFHRWLDLNLENFGFYRPYKTDRGGVSPEPWHISHKSIARTYFENHSIELLSNAIQNADILLKEDILSILPEIFENYFLNVD